MMLTGWRYRATGILGAAILTIAAVWMANHPFSQSVFTSYVPLFWRLEPTVLSGSSLQLAMLVSVLFVVITLIPLFKPRPRRMLDTIVTTQKQVGIAGLGLATLGFFKWSHRLPRATLVMVVGLLAITLPAWFLWIRVQPAGSSDRAIVVGDDMAQLDWILKAADVPVVGYLCPPSTFERETTGTDSTKTPVVADGGAQSLVPGHDVDHLGGLSKLEKMLVKHDIDTVILAFRTADRGEFFGTLDTCYEHGVTAKVHRQYADDVLTTREQVGDLIDIDLEPWDPQDYLFKRLFDIAFAGVGLLVLSPLMILIAIAVKLDSDGPVLYEQARTAAFGERFTVYKFRSMVTDAEAETGATISNEDAGGIDPRVTRVGRVLRKTHLDEVPQLWSILRGDMSVVGPRPERPEIDSEIQMSGIDWSKRWFIKPGLTGLAQINDVTGHEPDAKLRYDIQYIRKQSLAYDIMIVIRQIWMVVSDVLSLIVRPNSEGD